MADIAPFRGLLYDQKLVPDIDAVITPPYDVISPEEQEMYYRRHPYNMIRLILGKEEPEDGVHNNWYARAAETLQTWIRAGVLTRDFQSAIYDYEIDYREPAGLVTTRRGFICLVRLQDFSHGSVRPHERTYEETKSERLKLMCACNANLSQIFALYADPAHTVSNYLADGRASPPIFDFEDSAGIQHRMWRVSRQDIIEKVAADVKGRPLFIADGHHRYETALNYQKLMQQKYPARGKRASFNYVLMYLSNMNQAGLSILPTHRMLLDLTHVQMNSFLARAADYFEVVRFPFDSTGRDAVRSQFLSSLQSADDRNSMGVYGTGASQFALLNLRADVNHDSWRRHLPPPLQGLDVVVFNELVLKHLLNVKDRMLDGEMKIQYCHDAREALDQVDSGLFRAAFLLNPTKIEQVQEVANAALIMPHKSTYFFPKVITGSVLNLLEPEEDVPC